MAQKETIFNIIAVENNNGIFPIVNEIIKCCKDNGDELRDDEEDNNYQQNIAATSEIIAQKILLRYYSFIFYSLFFYEIFLLLLGIVYKKISKFLIILLNID